MTDPFAGLSNDDFEEPPHFSMVYDTEADEWRTRTNVKEKSLIVELLNMVIQLVIGGIGWEDD